MPDALKALIDPRRNQGSAELEAVVTQFTKPSYERSPVGRKARGQRSEEPLARMQALAALLYPLDDDNKQYPLPYYPAA
jgi:hypothetical protein